MFLCLLKRSDWAHLKQKKLQGPCFPAAVTFLFPHCATPNNRKRKCTHVKLLTTHLSCSWEIWERWRQGKRVHLKRGQCQKRGTLQENSFHFNSSLLKLKQQTNFVVKGLKRRDFKKRKETTTTFQESNRDFLNPLMYFVVFFVGNSLFKRDYFFSFFLFLKRKIKLT